MEEDSIPLPSKPHAEGWKHYHILGVRLEATQDEVKARYRRLALLFHPDKNPGAEDKFKLITEAYAVLSDAERRKNYDRLIQDAPRAPAPSSAPSGTTASAASFVPVQPKIDVPTEDMQREWMIWTGLLVAVFALQSLMPIPWAWFSSTLATFWAWNRSILSSRALLGIMSLSPVLAAMFPLPFLSALAYSAILAAGTTFMNRLTIQIDLSLLSFSVGLALAMALPLPPSLSLFSAYLAAHTFLSSLFLIPFARRYWDQMHLLLHVRSSFVLAHKHLLFPLALLLLPLPLVHVRLLLGTRSGNHLEWLALGLLLPLLTLDAILARSWRSVGLYLASSLFVFLPAIVPVSYWWLLFILIHISLLLWVGFKQFLPFLLHHYPDLESTSLRPLLSLSALLGALFLGALSHLLPPTPLALGLGSLAAASAALNSLNLVCAPFVSSSSLLSRLISSIREWSERGDTLGGKAPGSAGGFTPQVRFDSVAKNKSKAKEQPGYQSARQQRREAEREARKTGKLAS